MFPTLNELRQYAKFDSIRSDNLFFIMSTRFLCLAHLLASILLTFQQFVGNPFVCTHSPIPDGLTQEALTTHCWISSTFINVITDKRQIGQLKFPSIHPGVPPTYASNGYYGVHPDPLLGSWNGPVRKQAYYKWIFVVLFFQGVMHYFPALLWRKLEGGKLKVISSKPLRNDSQNKKMRMKKSIRGQFFKGCRYDADAERRKEHKAMILSYVLQTTGRNTGMFSYIFLCESLSLVILVFSAACSDLLIGGDFIHFGYDTIHGYFFRKDYEVSLSNIIFPKIGKCFFRYTGTGGSAVPSHGICWLPMNELNEWIYLIQWWSIATLIIFGAATITYHVILAGVPWTRAFRLWLSAHVNMELCWRLSLKLKLGDFFLLLYLCNNIDPLVYDDVLKGLDSSIELTKGM